MLLMTCCLSWSIRFVAAQETPTMKCSTSSCTAENGFTDEMVTQFNTKDGNWEHERLLLNNVSNEDLKKLPALNDKLKILTFWNESAKVTDITPLAKLTNLKGLELRNLVNLADINPIAGLKQLESLDLYNLKPLTDLTPIGKVEGLKKLSLVVLGEPIDLSPVSNLVNLQELSIGQSVKYTSFDFLTPLNNLEKLSFVAEPKDVTDISPLAGKTKLKELGFSGAEITDISVLKDSPELERLHICGTKVADLTVLKELKKLKSLRLGYIKVEQLIDLTPVGELSELKYLELTATQFTDFAPLAKCTGLEQLDAQRETNFDNLEAIKALPNLITLNLWANEAIQDWDALAEMTNLKELYMGKTSFSDLSLLSNLNNLSSLSVSDCTVTNPEAIATLPKLRGLNVDGTQGIADISIFKNLAQIADFYLRHKQDQFPQEQLDAINQAKEAAKKLQTVFEDPFRNNNNKWYEADQEECFVKVQEEKYVFEHKREEGSWMTWNPIPLDSSKDFHIEATLSKTHGPNNSGYGIIWGLKDVNNRYQFLVNGNGWYTYAKTVDGNWETIIEWAESSYVHKDNGTNTLTVKRFGDTLKLYINDRYITEAPFEEFFGPKVGFFVHGPTRTEIDRILVKGTKTAE